MNLNLNKLANTQIQTFFNEDSSLSLNEIFSNRDWNSSMLDCSFRT